MPGDFNLPVRMDTRVEKLAKQRDGFSVTAGGERFEAENVIVAMGNYQQPREPEFARQLDPAMMQIHSGQYRNPAQLQDGGVLVVGVGNWGAPILLWKLFKPPDVAVGEGNRPYSVALIQGL